ncbi:MAG TPA: response regulator [Terriglobales bacterium]|nr:response regulator [Terriglobales bacterium]HXY13089.1 response regulator [Terriglobales bacterium]
MDKPKILIIDDDADMRRALHIRLRSQGYETAFASDGMSAISSAMKMNPNLILLDLGLPAGDGFVVLERLQKNTKLCCIPVIVLTAREGKGNKEKALASGACAFFQKPAENDVLLSIIEKALRDTGALAR